MGSRAEWCSSASGGLCWKVFSSLELCMLAMCPLSVGLLDMFTRCSVPIVAALLRMESSPSPNSVVGLCIASVGNPGVTPRDWRAALLRIVSMLVSCVFVNMPR